MQHASVLFKAIKLETKLKKGPDRFESGLF